jgi:ATP-binding cassette subfamily B protein
MEGIDQLGAAGPAADSLLGSLVIAARHRGIRLTAAQLTRDHQLHGAELTPERLVLLAEAEGLRATIARLRWADLLKLDKALPTIVLLRNGSAMVLQRIQTDGHPPHIILEDPNGQADAPLRLDEARFAAAWTGDVILIKRDYRLRDEEQPFGFRWIIGQLLRDRRVFRDILLASTVLSFVALSPMIFWRLLIDRVMYYGSWSTFAAICIGYALLLGYETLFGHLRRHLVAFVTTRVDAKLATYTFNKVLQLPIEFFERTPAGEILRDMNEAWKVRAFLANHLFGTLLDCILLFVFLPLMLFFSAALTACVLAICGLICLWTIAMLPAVQRKVAAAAKAEAGKNAFLVETLHGIRAVKSLALDSRQRHQWDVLAAKAAQRQYEQQMTANLVQTVVTPLHGLMTQGVFALAVFLTLYLQEPAYIGALVAFMMLTSRVAHPLLAASSMIVQLDEARLAMNYIAGLVNRPSEEGRRGNGLRSPITCRVEFNEVTFRYHGTSVPALDRVSFTIPEGTTFGVVGRSGSGKTTVTRLLQLLHSDYTGLIKIDGNDLKQLDLDHLRSNVGIVLQENFLFRGPIRETIASGKPDASFEEVVQAARLAGAEEFIERLPMGYETHIQEGSSNLSGGQRQRLAIARALITNPPILILDEATSALDADSEAIVNANLQRIGEGRTLIIISHRLSSLVEADAILVLERGKVYDIGRHEELLDRCDIYSGLWHTQNRHLLSKASHEIIPFRPSAAQ